MSEAGKATAAGMVMSAGIASAAVGGALAGGEATGLIIAATRRAVQAGVQGWDVDGNYVCSVFVFNFRTMEVFDGSETHSINDITKTRYQDNMFLLYLDGRVEPKVIKIGNELRGEAIHRVIEAMWDGVVFEPDTRSRHPGSELRLRLPGVGTLIRYGVRSVILGLIMSLIIKTGLDPDGYFTFSQWTAGAIAIFSASMAWRLLRPITLPSWRNHQ
jgi:hypothetical protein